MQLGKLKSGESVFDRDDYSHLHTGVHELLPEVFEQITAGGKKFIVTTVDLGRVVGQSTRVLTDENDEIVFVQRVGRKGLTRFVKNRVAENSSQVTIVLKRDLSLPKYTLLTAWIGSQSELEPWDPKADYDKSAEFWSRNALIYGSEKVVPGTETKICPW